MRQIGQLLIGAVAAAAALAFSLGAIALVLAASASLGELLLLVLSGLVAATGILLILALRGGASFASRKLHLGAFLGAIVLSAASVGINSWRLSRAETRWHALTVETRAAETRAAESMERQEFSKGAINSKTRQTMYELCLADKRPADIADRDAFCRCFAVHYDRYVVPLLASAAGTEQAPAHSPGDGRGHGFFAATGGVEARCREWSQ